MDTFSLFPFSSCIFRGFRSVPKILHECVRAFRLQIGVGSIPWKSWVLKFVPDLRRTPSTILVSPTNYESVLRAIETSETLINNRSKMDSLRGLLNEVYSDREQPFHWDRKSMIELNGAYVASPEVESDDIPQGAQGDILQFEYSYQRGDMVAARPGDASDLFWVAQVKAYTMTTEVFLKCYRCDGSSPPGISQRTHLRLHMFQHVLRDHREERSLGPILYQCQLF